MEEVDFRCRNIGSRVVLEYLPVGGHEEGPRSTGRIDYAHFSQRLDVRPVNVRPPVRRKRQPRQNGRRRYARIVGRQQLSVRDEPVEYHPRQVMPPNGPHAQQPLRRSSALIQYARGLDSREFFHHVLGHNEYRVVVDFQDRFPKLEQNST